MSENDNQNNNDIESGNDEQSSTEESESSYQGLFVLGITFTGAGAALMSTNPGMVGLLAMGIIFMALGLSNRDKWQSESIS